MENGELRVTKLELNWIGKYDGEQPRPEPRILLENAEYSYGIESGELRVESEKPRAGIHSPLSTHNSQFTNMLIHGDNLLALKSLELEYAGRVKCVYIDPPYNTLRNGKPA